MINFSTIQGKMTRSFGRGALLVKKYSPEILLGVGLVGMVSAAVMASKATLKAEEIVIDHMEKVEKTNTALEIGTSQYTKEDHDKDLAVIYVQTFLKFGQLYGPALGIGALSITAILASHGIMSKRQVSLIAAYNLLSEGFLSYRKRVIDELGEEVDKDYRLGLRTEVVTDTDLDEEGKKIKVRKNVKRHDPAAKSIYAKFFDESSPQWRTDPTLNLYFLKAQQNYINDVLISRGHVFLNEVYDALGIPRTQAGAIVGWILEEGNGDKYIDFDIYNVENAPGRDFVNGYNRSILLDFNVDGVIYDLIRQKV